MTQLRQSDLKSAAERLEALKLAPKQVLLEIGFALQIINASAKLQKCSKASIQSAIVQCISCGLTLNPVSKEAHLIPRNKKTGDGWVTECVFEPDYRGLAKLVMQTGAVQAIQTQLVYKNDTFEIDKGDWHKPVTHKPHKGADRGEILGVYSMAMMPSGIVQVEYMDLFEVYEKARDRSESWKAYQEKKIKTCTWVTDEGEMIRKTCFKRITKYLPRQNNDAQYHLDKAIESDNHDYKATIQQVTMIDSLLRTANLPPEQKEQYYGQISTGTFIGALEANNLISFLKGNQLDALSAGNTSITALSNAANEAAQRPNT